MPTRLALPGILVVFCLVLACSPAAPGGDPASPGTEPGEKEEALLLPRLEIAEPQVDVGEVARGKTAQHVFVVKNTGNAPLEIRQTRASCGCTAAVVDNKIVPPGGEAKIDVKLSTQGFSGKISKPVTVESNDPHNPNAQLTISATVRIDLDFERPFLRLHPARIGQTVSDTVPIIVNVPEAVTFETPVTDMEGLTVSLVDEPGLDGKTIKTLKASYTPKQAGRFNGAVTLKTSHPEHPELVVRAVATVRGDIDFSPSSLHFMEGGEKTLDVTLTSATRSFKILSATDSQGLVSAVVEPKNPASGKSFTLRVTQNEKAAELGRGFSTWLRIETDDPSQPLLEIPVVSVTRPRPPTPDAQQPGQVPGQ